MAMLVITRGYFKPLDPEMLVGAFKEITLVEMIHKSSVEIIHLFWIWQWHFELTLSLPHALAISSLISPCNDYPLLMEKSAFSASTLRFVYALNPLSIYGIHP